MTASREFDPVLREYAISVLSDFKRPQDLAFVISMMRDGYIQDVAQTCIQKKWGVEAVDALLARLPDRDDDAMCLIEALGIIGDERALEPQEPARLAERERGFVRSRRDLRYCEPRSRGSDRERAGRVQGRTRLEAAEPVTRGQVGEPAPAVVTCAGTTGSESLTPVWNSRK